MEFIDPRKTPFVPLSTRGELPHLYKPGCCLFVTWRLLDAVGPPSRPPACPAPKLSQIAPEELVARHDPPLTLGSCVLRSPPVAQAVQRILLRDNGSAYQLVSWCVMPNHVHVIFAPLGEAYAAVILRRWKGATARWINQHLSRAGPLWERESFDHLIHSADHLDRLVRYIELNPVEAGLCPTPEGWPWSSAVSGYVPA